MAADELGERGAQLWAALGLEEGTTLGVLGLEACRAADRLDELDRIIAGRGVLNLMQFRLHMEDVVEDPRATVTVKFDSVLAEARQQQGVLRQMLVTLTAAGAGQGSAGQGAPQEGAAGGASSTVDEFTARRRGRQAGA